jgi:Acyl-coenzyme A synthetases/AMP-(fatty) acid ligases
MLINNHLHFTPDCTRSDEEIGKELKELVREAIGPIAAFKLSTSVTGLPRTRSGKTARKSIVDMARNKPLRVRLVYLQQKL